MYIKGADLEMGETSQGVSTPSPGLEPVNVVAPPPQPHGETNPSRPPSIVQEFPARNAEGTPTEGGEDIVGGGDALLLLGASEILVRLTLAGRRICARFMRPSWGDGDGAPLAPARVCCLRACRWEEDRGNGRQFLRDVDLGHAG